MRGYISPSLGFCGRILAPDGISVKRNCLLDVEFFWTQVLRHGFGRSSEKSGRSWC